MLVLSKAHWTELGPEDPAKALAQEVFRTVRLRLPWTPTNGSVSRANGNRSGDGLLRESDSNGEDKRAVRQL